MAENLPNLVKDVNLQIQETVEPIPNKINPKKFTSICIIKFRKLKTEKQKKLERKKPSTQNSISSKNIPWE